MKLEIFKTSDCKTFILWFSSETLTLSSRLITLRASISLDIGVEAQLGQDRRQCWLCYREAAQVLRYLVILIKMMKVLYLKKIQFDYFVILFCILDFFNPLLQEINARIRCVKYLESGVQSHANASSGSPIYWDYIANTPLPL